MRALVVHPGPAFSVADVYAGWVKGLRDNGIQVGTLNLDARLDFYGSAHIKREGEYVKAFSDEDAVRMASLGIKAAVYDFWPDVVVFVSAFFVPRDFYEVFRDRGHKVVIIHTESPYEDQRQVVRAMNADLNVINDPTNIETFRAAAPTVYIPHAFDPERHHPRTADPDCASDFCFVGTGYPSRIRFFEQVDWSGIDAAFAGNWQDTREDSPLRGFLTHPLEQCCPNDEAVRLYASTKVSANVYRREAETDEQSFGWSMTPREVELAATGVFFLRESRGESDEVLPMLPTFTGAEEFGDLVRYWAARDAERGEAALAARAAVADRTFASNAAQMLQALGV
jgi:spore maturation protein CgeB